MSSLIDAHLPDPDRSEVHSIQIAQPPAVAMAAARSVSAGEIPVAVALMAIRSLPALLVRKRPPAPKGTVLSNFGRMGFVVLDDTPGEFVVGGIGRFWRPSGDLVRIAPDEFDPFAEPGYAKAVFQLPRGAGWRGRDPHHGDAYRRHGRCRASQLSLVLAPHLSRQRADPARLAARDPKTR